VGGASVPSRRHFWEDDYRGGISADWIVVGLFIVLLVAGVIGFWFNDMYQNHYGIFQGL
jgi:hypothetical protein